MSRHLPSEHTSLTPEKARKILRDGKVRGKPLTERARRFMFVIANKGKRRRKRR